MFYKLHSSICLFLSALSLSGCSETPSPIISSDIPLTGEYIYRQSHESSYHIEPMISKERQPYPWEEESKGIHSKITKEFFRCNGCSLNPVRIVQKNNETLRFYDCDGPQKHSLPLSNGKEFIYPILIDLLNAIQQKTGKRVVITCGHCCPEHNLYLDASVANQSSKHQLGAEVDFYVQGMENEPEKIVDIILQYYRENQKYKEKKEFTEFKRYEKPDSHFSIRPWFNEEIFVKIVSKHECRDFDNRHPYPYISIQVRYDFETKEKVTYSWNKAFRNFHRW